MRKKLRALLATAALMLAGGLASASPASANTNFPSTVNPGDMRWCTSTQAFCQQVLTRISSPTPGKMVCWWNDQGTRWFYVFLPNGQEGYVHSSMIPASTQTPTPECTTINWLNVSNWAIARLSAIHVNPAADGVSTPTGRWSGFCLTFARAAWTLWGGVAGPTGWNVYPNHIWDWFGANNPGARHVGGRPPRGALVFWGTAPWHIAISLGNWQAVGTWGFDNEAHPVKTYGILSNLPNYTGWIMPQAPTVPHNAS